MSLKLFATLLFVLLITQAYAKQHDIVNIKNVAPKEHVYEQLTFERVIDGDTFIASNRKIRLWGIDAPEKNEPLYRVTSKALELFLETGVLECKLIDMDKYKRYVMHCLSDGKDIGALMVKIGFAKDYKKYSGGLYQTEQKFAKDALLGIWENEQK